MRTVCACALGPAGRYNQYWTLTEVGVGVGAGHLQFSPRHSPVVRMMGAPDSRGRRLLFPRALPRLSPLVPGPSQDHEKKRKIAVKCLELEEMLEKQG